MASEHSEYGKWLRETVSDIKEISSRRSGDPGLANVLSSLSGVLTKSADHIEAVEAERDALRTALVDSTELLRVALCLPDGEAYGFVDQIAANEAVLAKGSER